jgi:hypothetical protein
MRLFRNLNFESQYHWKIERLGSYKKALQFVADNYPNTEEGKSTNFEGPNSF